MKQGRQNKRLLSLIVSFVLLLASVCALTACGKKLESIEITTAPTVTKYMAGDTFNPDGMVVSGKYDNGETAVLEGWTYDLTAPLKETDTKVVVSYEGFTAEVSIKVSNPVTSVSIKTHATKTEYRSGETFDPTGMVLTVTYYDNSTKDVAIADLEANYSKDPLKVGQTEVEIKVEGLSVKETITVTRGNIIESAVDNSFASTKTYSKIFTYYSKGTVLNNTGKLSGDALAPEGAMGNFDNRDGGSLSYIFKLKEAGKVDLVWNVAGSVWNGSGATPAERNEGVTDLGEKIVITIDGNKTVDVSGIALPRGDGETAPIWWNLQKVIVKDLDLEAGEHTFKVDPIFNVNVGSFEVHSTSEIEEEKSLSLDSVELVEKDTKACLVVKGSYAGYKASDFSANLVKLADSSTSALEPEFELKESGLFMVTVDLSAIESGLGDLLVRLTAADKTLDLEFAGKEDGTVAHLTLGVKSYTLRYEASKTENKPVVILTVDSAFDAAIDNKFASAKANSLTLNYYSAGTSTNGQLKEESGAPSGGLGNLGSSTSYVIYKFKLAKSGLVDLVLRAAGSTWQSGNVNAGVNDLSKAATLTIDKTSIGVNGIELPSGDGSDESPKWWNMQKIVLKNLELSAGEHTFKIALLGDGGVNVGDLTVYSDESIGNVAEYDSELVKASLEEADKSTKANKIEFWHGSNGFACQEDVFKNNGSTGPALGLKGFDHVGRWITYTFALQEETTVDFVWQVSGSNWQSGNINAGVNDLFNTTILTIDGTQVDVRGYSLPAGTDNDDPDNLVWWYYYDIVIENVTLSAGIHTFRADALGGGGVNVSFLKVYSDKTLIAMSDAKVEKTEVGSYETANANSKTYVWDSEGVANEGALSNATGSTGPKTGIKGLDSKGRWLTYTFNLSEDGVVDFIWQISGSKWDTITHNPGIDDMGNRVIVTIDGKALDVSGIELPGGNGVDAPAYWKLYDLVIKNVSLSAGEHVFKVYATGYEGGINIASMTIASSSSIS